MFLSDFIDIVGRSVCHQLPSRTISVGGILFPSCARCSGIYIGFFVAAVILFLMFRKKQSNLPPIYVLVILLVFILSTIIDGALSYLTPMTTNNVLRYLTGFLCGASIMVIIFPIFNFEYFKDALDKKIFQRPMRFVIFLLIIALFIFITLIDIGFLGLFFYYLNGFSILFTFFFINLVLVLLIPVFSKRSKRLFSRYLLVPAVIATALSAFELFLSYRLHIFLNAL